MADEATRPADPEVFPPTLREVMLRPWWLGMLGVALLIAAIFAWLGQWQLSSAIDTDPADPGMTEVVQPIDDVTVPGEYLPEPLVGQKVEVTGAWVPGDFLVVSSRYNDGVQGYWVTGQFRLSDPADPTSLAVALGWTATQAEADAVASALEESVTAADATLTGRLIADEGPANPPKDGPITVMTRMSPAALLGWWHDVDELNVYRPYLVADADTLGPMAVPDDLVAIDSPAPELGSNVNWLNIFYAAEWVIFAGFAFYMWYRLARDAWEKEVEALEERAGGDPDPAD